MDEGHQNALEVKWDSLESITAIEKENEGFHCNALSHPVYPGAVDPLGAKIPQALQGGSTPCTVPHILHRRRIMHGNSAHPLLQHFSVMQAFSENWSRKTKNIDQMGDILP